MIKKQIISKLLLKYENTVIEQCLIISFIKKHKLDTTLSSYLNSYLASSGADLNVLKVLADIDIESIKELENYLELLIPKSDRKLNGAFFTPSYITEFIINEISPKKNDKTLDPSCGSGAFLLTLLEYHHKKLNKDIKSIIEENIYGVDILAYNVNRTKLMLSLYAVNEGYNLNEVSFNVFTENSLSADWLTLFPKVGYNFDNIIGNPPYVKFQDLSNDLRSLLLTNWKSIKKGTFNLYFAFFELGFNLLKPNGRLGYITPNNYFTSIAGESLRNYLKYESCIDKIIDFNSKKVFDVQTYTAITFLIKSKIEDIKFSRIGDDQVPKDFLNSLEYSINKTSTLKIKKWRLLKTSEQKNIEIIETLGISIGKRYNIKVGIATLKDDLYFINGNQNNENFYYKKLNNRLFPIEKEITLAIYKISDFSNSIECVKNIRRIIFPYERKLKQTVIIQPDKLKAKFPKCYEYFEYIREMLAKRDKGKSLEEMDIWYKYGRSQALNYVSPKLLTPTFSKRPRFMSANDDKALFCNGYALFCKENNLDNLFPTLSKSNIDSLDNLDVIQKILNSELMHYYISVTSVSIEGGYPCYQKNFIEKFTIPEFSTNEIQELRSLDIQKDIDKYLISKYNVDIPFSSKSFSMNVH